MGTWACSPYKATSNTPPKALSNNTLRQIVRVSIGGDTLRVKFSNITFTSSISLNSANIAFSPDGTKSAIDASTIKALTFNGKADVTINAKSEVYSDPVAFDLKPSMRVAITTYYGSCPSSQDMTFHYGSRTNSYLLTGDQTASADFSGATTVERWYTISNIDVVAPSSAAAVACFGNSITDGYGLSGGLQNRWTDAFSEKLLANPSTAQVGVLNEGIGATKVTGASNGAESGINRFEHDILGLSGLRWVIIYYGINDLAGGASANAITNGFKTMINKAHTQNVKVYGATITPCGTYSDASYTSRDQARNEVNTWIRAAGNFDGVIDFDKVIRDPSQTKNLQSKYSKDGLHPNADGYKLLGESIDLDLFTVPTEANLMQEKKNKDNVLGEIFSIPINGNTMITFTIPHESFVSLKAFSMLGKEIAELAGRAFSSGRHTIKFESKNLPKGIYLFSIKAGNFSASQKMILPVH